MTPDPKIVHDDFYVRDGWTFDIHARKTDNGENYEGFVYLGVEIVFHVIEPVSATPAGIEDFADVVMCKFAKRIAALLEAT